MLLFQNDGINSGFQLQYKNGFGNTRVIIDCLDEVLMNLQINPTHIKIDTEGMELDILNGAKRTIVSFRPIIFIEIHRFLLTENQIKEVYNILKHFCYTQTYKLEDGTDISRETWIPY